MLVSTFEQRTTPLTSNSSLKCLSHPGPDFTFVRQKWKSLWSIITTVKIARFSLQTLFERLSLHHSLKQLIFKETLSYCSFGKIRETKAIYRAKRWPYHGTVQAHTKRKLFVWTSMKQRLLERYIVAYDRSVP